MGKRILFIVLFFSVSRLLAQTNHLPPTGNVGVGVAAPLKTFEVLTPANDYASIGARISAGQYAGLHFGFFEPENIYYRKSALVFERLDNAARGKIHFLNNSSPTPASADLNDARLTINYDGKIGINNVDPTAELDVNGEVKWSGFNAGNSRALKIGYSGGNYGGIGYNMDFSAVSGKFSRPFNDRSSYVEFSNGGFNFYGTQNSLSSTNIDLTGGGQNLNLFATIQANGNMGLGVAMPQEKLSVNGNIRAKEIKVEAANWPDYVFDPDYKITSLAELEKYIKAHKHLPEMPSAKVAESEGVEVGNMIKLQQQKIEELTLHLIAKDKEITVQKEKLSKLEQSYDSLSKQVSDFINKTNHE